MRLLHASVLKAHSTRHNQEPLNRWGFRQRCMTLSGGWWWIQLQSAEYNQRWSARKTNYFVVHLTSQHGFARTFDQTEAFLSHVTGPVWLASYLDDEV